ncbi:MAG: tetratricopeptide repeat protein [Candidatus Eremiobacteraeota bacterium]|nr:tetratricopeptide repeat protein [Candidatus Eremiobacteraeota bacterium]
MKITCTSQKLFLLLFIMLLSVLCACQKEIENSKSPSGDNRKAASMLLKSGIKHLEERDLLSARRDLESAARLNPEDPGIFVALGDVYDELYLLKEAEAAFRTAISLSPKNPEAHWAFGMIFYQMDKYRQAENALKTALRLDTACSKAYYDLGHIYLRQGKISEAEKAYKNSIKIGPDNPCAYIGMGEFLIYRGRLDEAKKILDMALVVNEKAIKDGKTKSEEGHIRTALAKVLVEKKDFENAEKQAYLAIKADPGVAGSYYVMGELKRDTGNLDESASWLEKAIKINPYDISFFVTLADIETRRNRMKRAEELYKKAMSMNPQEKQTLHSIQLGLGEIALSGKDYKNAKDRLEHAWRLVPESSKANYLLAEAYAALEKEGSCRKILTGLAKRDPGRIEKAFRDPAFEKYHNENWFKNLLPEDDNN